MSKLKDFFSKKPDPEKERELQDEPLEKGDFFAMMTAAFTTLFLPAVVALLLFGGVIYLIFVVL